MKKKELSEQLKKHIKHTANAAQAISVKGDNYHWLFASLYKYPWHFLEELLQNAQDAYVMSMQPPGQRYVRFDLHTDKFIFSHEGKAFDEHDIISISSTGNTMKRAVKDYRIIGKFGIGFKSVFLIAESVQIQSANYFFELDKYQMLNFLDENEYSRNTVFYFPLRNQDAFNLTYYSLQQIDWKQILFVHGYDIIEIHSPDFHRIIEKRRQIIGKHLSFVSVEDKYFMVYTFTKQSVLIELAIPCRFENDVFVFLKLDCPVPLFYYFPTLETISTGMYIQANWMTTPTRENILLESKDGGIQVEHNRKILQYLPLAVRAFLLELKRLGYCNATLFEAMLACYPSSIIHPVERVFWNSIIDFMHHEKLVPSKKGHFLRIGEFIALPPETEHLLSEQDCSLLFGRKAFLHRSIVNIIRNNISLRVKLKEILMPDVTEVVHRIAGHADFLQKKTKNWHIKWIHFLLEYPEYWSKEHEDKYYSIRHKPILLSSDRKAIAPFQDGTLNVQLFQSKTISNNLFTLHSFYLSDKKCTEFLYKIGIISQKNSETKTEFTCAKPLIIGSFHFVEEFRRDNQQEYETSTPEDILHYTSSELNNIHAFLAVEKKQSIDDILNQHIHKAIAVVHKAFQRYYAKHIQEVQQWQNRQDMLMVRLKDGTDYFMMVSALKVTGNMFLFRKAPQESLPVTYYIGVDLDTEPPLIFIKHSVNMQVITEMVFG